MPKTTRSEQVDMKGLEVIADEFTGTFNGSVSNTAIDALTAVTTPDGSDATTTQNLANALKAKLNAVIAALQS